MRAKVGRFVCVSLLPNNFVIGIHTFGGDMAIGAATQWRKGG